MATVLWWGVSLPLRMRSMLPFRRGVTTLMLVCVVDIERDRRGASRRRCVIRCKARHAPTRTSSSLPHQIVTTRRIRWRYLPRCESRSIPLFELRYRWSFSYQQDKIEKFIYLKNFYIWNFEWQFIWRVPFFHGTLWCLRNSCVILVLEHKLKNQSIADLSNVTQVGPSCKMSSKCELSAVIFYIKDLKPGNARALYAKANTEWMNPRIRAACHSPRCRNASRESGFQSRLAIVYVQDVFH